MAGSGAGGRLSICRAARKASVCLAEDAASCSRADAWPRGVRAPTWGFSERSDSASETCECASECVASGWPERKCGPAERPRRCAFRLMCKGLAK